MVGRGKDVSDDELYAALQNASEPLTTAEVASAVGLKRRGTLKRLKEHSDIDGKQGVWWCINADAGTPPAESTPSTEPDPPEPVPEPEPIPDAERIERAIADLDLPGDSSQVAAKQAALRACIDALAGCDGMTKSDFIEEVYPDHPATYGSAESWWKWIGQTALKELATELPELHAPKRGFQTWRFDGAAGEEL